MENNTNIDSACLERLVDVFRPVLVGLFHWQLCLFELQELAPKNLSKNINIYIPLMYLHHGKFIFIKDVLLSVLFFFLKEQLIWFRNLIC